MKTLLRYLTTHLVWSHIHRGSGITHLLPVIHSNMCSPRTFPWLSHVLKAVNQYCHCCEQWFETFAGGYKCCYFEVLTLLLDHAQAYPSKWGMEVFLWKKWISYHCNLVHHWHGEFKMSVLQAQSFKFQYAVEGSWPEQMDTENGVEGLMWNCHINVHTGVN